MFSALDAFIGEVIGKCYKRHRVTEFKRFLNEIERLVPADHDVHIVMDNYAPYNTSAPNR